MITHTPRTRQGLVAACTIAVALSGFSGFSPKNEPGFGPKAAYAQSAVKDVDALIKELKQPSPYGTEEDDVHSMAVGKLVKIGRPAVPKLIEALKDDKAGRWAARALGEIGDPQAILPLAGMLGSEDKDMWAIASAAIVEIAKANPTSPDIAKAVGVMVGMFKDDSKHASTVQELGEIGSPAFAPLIAALRDRDRKVRAGAAEALGKGGDVRAIPGLVERLEDENEDVRADAAEAIVEIAKANPRSPGVAKAVGLLIKRLKDDDGHESAVQVLGEIGSPAFAPLIAALRDRDRKVRAGAAEALGELNDARALPSLRRASRSDQDEKAGNAADEAIEKIVGKKR